MQCAAGFHNNRVCTSHPDCHTSLQHFRREEAQDVGDVSSGPTDALLI